MRILLISIFLIVVYMSEVSQRCDDLKTEERVALLIFPARY